GNPNDPSDDVTDESSDPTPVTEPSDPDCTTCTETEIPQNPMIQIVKSDNAASVDEVGDVITYTLTITNTGNVTLSSVMVNDPLTELAENVGALIPGQSTELSTEYVITQDDLDNGSVLNKALTTGDSPNGEDPSDEDEVTTEVIQSASITIEKVADKEFVQDVDEVITYTLTVQNTGNVTLTNVIVDDPLTGFSSTIESLATGASQVFTTTYTVTLEVLQDENEVYNKATVVANSPEDGTVKDDDDASVEIFYTPPSPAADPAILIDKVADKQSVSTAGEVITYTLTVSNDGGYDLINVVVKDPLTGFETTIASLPEFGVETFTTTYTVTAEDIAANDPIVNVATATTDNPVDPDNPLEDKDEFTVDVDAEIIANDDDYGTHFISFGGLLGNILDNDLLGGVRPDPADVDFEFTDLDGIVGLMIDENGELSLIPGVNEAREYTLKYTLREVAYPDNQDDAVVFIALVNDEVNLNITKTSFEKEIFVGDEFEYEIVLSNIGGTLATNVIVSDDLPNNVIYLSSEVTDNSSNADVTVAVTGSRLTWTIPSLDADATVTFRVKVEAQTAGAITNIVLVDSEEEDTDESDNQANDVNTIKPFHIPNVITPNNDGDNDSFEIEGISIFVSTDITIFNRFGDHVLEQKNYKNDWDAPGQTAGTYFYVLKATDKNGQEHEYKGWIQVIKD
ncbi:DUF7507 domain-containing protein, partial [Algoriphagus chordae]